MSKRNRVPVRLGIVLMSGMFLLGQESWEPPNECIDTDGDGYRSQASPLCTYPQVDCNDSNPDVNPGATEGPYGDPSCSDTRDNDCDGIADTPDDGCVKGIILDQELNASDKGYTVMRVWGSHYEMGYAHASLLRDSIVGGIAQFKQKVGQLNYMFQVPPGLECARAEWVWGDGSKSTRMSDPVDGKCETVLIERHLYRQTGDMTVSLRLKTADREQLFSTWLVIKE